MCSLTAAIEIKVIVKRKGAEIEIPPRLSNIL